VPILPWGQPPGTTIIPPPSGGPGLGVYGDGSDGAHTFDGSTTILGMVPSGNAYTLARDIFLSSSTINVGVSIITNGFRLFCQGTLTNNGTIQWNGNPGASTNTTSLGGATLSNANSSIRTGTQGSAGGNGNNATNGSAGTSNGTAALGGAGGHGGASGAGQSGGAGGTVTPPTVLMGSLRYLPSAIQGWLNASGATFQGILCGAGGGGGGGDGTGTGGGGGGGAGIVIVAAAAFAGTGTISANGGAGGNGFSNIGNSGGGGGGGGGVVIVISGSVSGGVISGQTVTATGGNHGSSVGAGGGTVTNGSSGTVILVPN